MSQVSLPSLHLPSIRGLSSSPISDLQQCLHYLRVLYNPQVRGSRRRGGVQSELDKIRADKFEHSYSIRWVIALLSQAETWPDSEQLSALLEDASSFLALSAGTSAAGIVNRTFYFAAGTPELGVKIRDIPLENQDYHSVGSQTWGGACVLSEMIADNPDLFGLSVNSVPLRVLELGAGTGLVSLTVGKLFLSLSADQRLPMTIVATDFYPSVLENLNGNILKNFPTLSEDTNLSILAHFLDWSRFPSDHPPCAPLSEPFDLVLGADIIYEADHALWIKECLSILLRKPAASDGIRPTFHLVIPLRSTHTSESGTIEKVFPMYAHDPCAAPAELQLNITKKESIVCDTDQGGDDTVEYAYYQIQWR